MLAAYKMTSQRRSHFVLAIDGVPSFRVPDIYGFLVDFLERRKTFLTLIPADNRTPGVLEGVTMFVKNVARPLFQTGRRFVARRIRLTRYRRQEPATQLIIAVQFDVDSYRPVRYYYRVGLVRVSGIRKKRISPLLVYLQA